MPELPEVETVVRGLNKYLPGQKIKNIKRIRAKSISFASGITLNKLKGLKILNLTRRGKGIIINLSKEISLLIHLKMTGQLIYIGKSKRINLGHPTKDFSEPMPSKHTRIIFELTKGTLYFNDQRLFGWIKALYTKDLYKDSFIKQLGMEPLSKDFNAEFLWQIIIKKPKSPIKSIILDQSNIAGIGNIYANEALFIAGIHPARPGKKIKKGEIKKLISAIKMILIKGIKYSGTSIVNYKTPEGSPGQMQKHLKVYNRAGLPCFKCKTLIKKIKTAGRGTYFCPKCQL